jgi:DNA-binding NarL/FixJ family response regulator
LVILDLSMPGMSARDAIQEIHRGWPGTRIVLSSGYDENEVLGRFQGMRLAGFVQKPYTAAQLAEKIKVAMGNGATDGHKMADTVAGALAV